MLAAFFFGIWDALVNHATANHSWNAVSNRVEAIAVGTGVMVTSLSPGADWVGVADTAIRITGKGVGFVGGFVSLVGNISGYIGLAALETGIQILHQHQGSTSSSS